MEGRRRHSSSPLHPPPTRSRTSRPFPPSAPFSLTPPPPCPCASFTSSSTRSNHHRALPPCTPATLLQPSTSVSTPATPSPCPPTCRPSPDASSPQPLQLQSSSPIRELAPAATRPPSPVCTGPPLPAWGKLWSPVREIASIPPLVSISPLTPAALSATRARGPKLLAGRSESRWRSISAGKQERAGRSSGIGRDVSTVGAPHALPAAKLCQTTC